MIDEARTLVALRAHVNLLEFCPHSPTPKQAELIADDRKEIFFGGRAGGGKSDGLLMAFLKFVDVPTYCGLIVRKTFKDLNKPGAIMDRAIQWFRSRPGVKWDGQDHVFTFPSGARLAFGHLENAKAHESFQGGEYQFIGMDEVPHIPEYQYRYLFSRLRRIKRLSVPLRMRSTGNPGGLEWVKKRFVDSATRVPNARFIESGIDDNPFLGDDYIESLAELDPVTRAQLRDGNWEITASGNTFRREWWGFVDEAPEGLRMVTRRWDMAATEPRPGFTDPDYLASCKIGMLGTGDDATYYILHATKDRRAPGDVLDYMESVALLDGRSTRVRTEREPGSNAIVLADQLQRGPFRGFDFQAVPSTKDKLVRARPLSAAANQGKVFLVRGDWNQWWIDDMATFPTSGVHDDTADAASGCYLDVVGKAAPSTARITTGLPRVTSGLTQSLGGRGGSRRGAMWR